MTRMANRTLWRIVLIAFIAALVVFFAVATSGFQNWNGNEWFNYWGNGKPAQTTPPNDGNAPNVEHSAVRLNSGVSATSDESSSYFQLIDTNRYEHTDGDEFSSKCYGWYKAINKDYDKFEYILEVQYSPTLSDSGSFGLHIQNMNFTSFELDYLYVLDSFEPFRQLYLGEYSPMGYTFEKAFPLYTSEPDYVIFLTITNEHAFLSCVPSGEGLSTYENSLNYILFDFGEYSNSLRTLIFSKLNTRINFQGSVFASETLNLYTEMDAPVKEGYTFTGWYYDEACTRPYKGEPITADTNLYAGFVINKYTVTFDLREVCDMDDPNAGDTYFHTIEVEYGQIATYTPAPVTGKTFLGWFDNSGAKYENTPIKQDTELIGHWANLRCTITFDVNGGDSEIASITVEYGTVPELPVPARTGYGFMGWICTNNPSFETSFPVTSDLTLRAEWKRNVFTVTFYVDNTVFKTIQVEYGQILGKATTDTGISPALVVGFENVNTTTVAATINDFEVIDDVVVYLSDTPDIPDVPDNKDKPTDKSDNQVVRFLSKNWILLTVCIVGGIILILIFAAAFKRKKH